MTSSARDLIVDSEYRVLPLDLELAIVSPPSTPQPVAEEVLRAYRMRGYHIIFWQQSWLVYGPETNGRYQRIDAADDKDFMINTLWLLLRDASYESRDDDGEVTINSWNPTTQRVSEVANAIRSYVSVSAEFSGRRWLSTEMESRYPGTELTVCKNGLVNTSEGQRDADGTFQYKLLDHDPRFVSEVFVDLEYDPTAVCIEWERFLTSVWKNDPLVINTLQEIMGLLISGETRVQKMFMLVGPTRSGKGTIARVIEALQGGRGRVDHPTLKRLGESFGLAPMLGKRVGIVGDARTAANPSALETLLGITGGDAVSVNRKNKAHMDVTLSIMFVIMSNKLPEFTDASGATAERVIPLQMTESFLGREDLNLHQRLMTELPGIFNWCLEGLKRLRASDFKFTMSESSLALHERLLGISSPVMRFVADQEYDVEADLRVERDAVWMAWIMWAGEQGETAGSKTGLVTMLSAAYPGIRERKIGGRGEKKIIYLEGIGRRYPA